MLKTPTINKTVWKKLVSPYFLGLSLTLLLTLGAFKWGVYYARNTPYEKVLTQDYRGNITTGLVKIMNDQDGVPYAIWHKDYLYTPDTFQYKLVTMDKLKL